MTRTIGGHFLQAVKQYHDLPLLAVPAQPGRAYAPAGAEFTFAQIAAQSDRLCAQLQAAGFGHGHRVAALLGNHPAMLVLKLACARLGISWVPINPDYRPAEIAYLLADSCSVLAICTPEFRRLMDQGIKARGPSCRPLPVGVLQEGEDWALPSLPRAPCAPPAAGRQVDTSTEASLIYTSGTTARPKGCILSHDYELAVGEWYANLGGRISFRAGHTRVYCPLPLFHINAAVLLFFAVLSTGSCQIVAERFSVRRWWPEIRATRATAAHYLGIIIPALMNHASGGADRAHGIEWAIGAGVEPTLHRAFERRFGFPLIEAWGMTEMCRLLSDCHEPRQVDTRAIGRPCAGLQVRVVDADDNELPRGTAGEMVVRHSAATPRRGAFSGYLHQPEATEAAWRGGWFHTGDTVRMDKEGMLIFVDRQKNIIRRSGENIAAAEVEACLQEHHAVERVAVFGVADALRDEEVMACVQLTAAARRAPKEQAPEKHPPAKQRSEGGGIEADLFAWCLGRLAYYKAPGWIICVEEVPVTSTQKVQKQALFERYQSLMAQACDFRAGKKRG